MPSIIILRAGNESDLAAIADIYNHEVLTSTATFDSEPRTLDDIRSWLFQSQRPLPVLVALKEGRLIGFSALYSYSPRKAYDITAENTVYLHRDFRGQGIGKRLLQTILAEAPKVGVRSVIARISSENKNSVALHENIGFKKIGVLKEVGKKFDRLLDVDLLQFIAT